MATRKAETQTTESDVHEDKKLKVPEQVATEAPAKKRGRPRKNPDAPPAPKKTRGMRHPIEKGLRVGGKGKSTLENKGKEEVLHVTTDAHANHSHAKAAASKTIEKGHLYFFYRPKVEMDDAASFDEVQKLYMVLRPETGGEGMNRLIVLTKKKLPKAASHDRYWGYVDKTSHNMDVCMSCLNKCLITLQDITHRLGPSIYETKTLGTRHQAGAKPCGCGVYTIVHHSGGGMALFGERALILLSTQVPRTYPSCLCIGDPRNTRRAPKGLQHTKRRCLYCEH